jgi:anti-sigma regulatory factor (Ser/Thr protein kinase)
MAELMLPPATDSVPVARRFAREQLRASGCDVDTVVLLVSEVVTNAVLHGRSDLRLRVDDRGSTARVEVADSSAKAVRMHEFGVESTTGRGLHLVAQLSLRWGAEPGTNGWGKVVWFEVGAPGEAAWESFG